jgi:hypothetical protein
METVSAIINNPINLAIVTAGIVGIIYIISRYSGMFKGFGIHIQGRIQHLNEQIRCSMQVWDVMRDQIWDLYVPIKQFILASVSKTTDQKISDPLIFEIVDRQLSVEVWRHFRKRFFENHFY